MIKNKGGLGVSMRPKGKVVSSTSDRGGSRKCVLVEMVGRNEFLESLASHGKESGPFSKETVNSRGFYARRKGSRHRYQLRGWDSNSEEIKETLSLGRSKWQRGGDAAETGST